VVVVADSAEAAMVAVMTTMAATATAGLHLPCTRPTGTPETTLPTGMPGTTRHPLGMAETTMTAGVAVGATRLNVPPLLTVAGPEGSGLGRFLTPHTGCLREAMVAAGLGAVATTGEFCAIGCW
jgi:hypothetical protein